jgi:hypothetical protein
MLHNPRNTHVRPKQRAPKLRTLRILLRLILLRARDPQLLANKARTRHIPRRQFNRADQLALGADLEDLPFAVHGLPDVAVSIHLPTVGVAGAVMVVEGALIGDGAGCGREVVGEDSIFGGVREKESLVVWHPADAVGDGDGVLHGVAGEVRVEAEEGALW